MNSQHLKAIVAACSLCASGLATANVTFSGFANEYRVATINAPVANLTVAAGGFSTSIDGGPSFVSYCVDVYQYLPSFGSSNGSYVVGNAASFFGDKLGAVSRLFSGFAGSVDTARESAAFQLALWEIKYETGSVYDLSSGSASFTTAADVGTLAASYLTGLAGITSNVQLHVLTSAGHQDVVYATPVPEPSTYALMIAGLIGVGTVARRRQTRR